MDASGNLVRWDVPFADARHPSVSLLTERGGDVATLVVAPKGVDGYPKYLVRFEKVLALLCYEEALALDRGYSQIIGFRSSVCAYRWADSPWLRASRGWTDFLQWPDLAHYLVFGGDSIVEMLAAGRPNAVQIDERTFIETKYEI